MYRFKIEQRGARWRPNTKRPICNNVANEFNDTMDDLKN